MVHYNVVKMIALISRSKAALQESLVAQKCKGPVNIEHGEQGSHAKNQLPHSKHLPPKNRHKREMELTEVGNTEIGSPTIDQTKITNLTYRAQFNPLMPDGNTNCNVIPMGKQCKTIVKGLRLMRGHNK